jgi:hypothetical protein
MHAFFAMPKITKSKPKLFLILEVIKEIFIKAYS